MMDRRDILKAAAAAPIVGLLPRGPASSDCPDASAAATEAPPTAVEVTPRAASERYFRIYRIAGNGTERVIEPCMTEGAAEAFVRVYNECSQGRPERAVAREIDIFSARLIDDVPPQPPRWRVRIVSQSTGVESDVWEYPSKEEADELAEWFGRDGGLRAEVVRVVLAPNVSPCRSWDSAFPKGGGE